MKKNQKKVTKTNSKEIGLKRALSIHRRKAILPVLIGLLGLGLMTCSDPADPATAKETPTPTKPGLVVSEFTTPDESKSYQRQFTVSLRTAPKAPVEVGIGGMGVVFSPTSLSFTADDWNTPQTVTATHTETMSRNVIITLSSSSDDPVYNGLSRELASVTLPPSPAYDLHVHDAQTPELQEGTQTARSVSVWFTIHPSSHRL